MTIDDEKLYKKFNLELEDFEGVEIDFDALKIRTSNCLRTAGILKLNQLLSSTYSKLSEIRNLGLLSLNDIEEYVRKLDGVLIEGQDNSRDKISYRIKKKRNLIYNGEFIDKLYEGLSLSETVLIDEFKEGYDLLDKDLIDSCKENPAYMMVVSNALYSFIRNQKKYSVLEKLHYALWNKNNNMLKPYFDIYSSEVVVSQELSEFCNNDELTLEYMFDNSRTDDSFIDEMIEFIKWTSYNLYDELKEFLDRIYSRNSSNTERVLELRAKKMTLQTIGDKLGITRERVRQIEKKVIEPFCQWQRREMFLPRLSAEFSGKKILEATDLQEYFDDMTEVVLYLLQCADDESFSYDRETDTIIIANDDITDLVRNYVEKMPNEFDVSAIDEYKNKALTVYDIPGNIFDREITNQYKVSGSLYHRNRLTLEKMYQTILSKYYPNGMNVYDDIELEKFKILIVNEFGDVSLPKNNRSISAAIGRTCVLCGRGKYKVIDHDKIPHELIARIFNYIMDSGRTFFFMNEIFLAFENDLLEAGIDNRFFLQGVLREEHGNDLFFRRDYVSKDSSNLSMYRELKLFVKKSKHPVTKDQIRKAYPGVTEAMISMALSDEDIINYFGSYVYCDNLNLYDYDKKYLSNIVEDVLQDGMPHHCNEIYEIMRNDNSELLNRLGVYYQYSMFSLLQYMFSGDYKFVRPYVALGGANINKPIELLQEYISVNELFEITEFLGLAKEYQYTIYDILKFLNSWNETHFLISKQEMASIDYIGVTEEMAQQMEQMILSELESQSLISELECIYKFPKINIQWNEWLIYSVINRWGQNIEVHTTLSQFRLSSPVVSKIGDFNRSDYDINDLGEMAGTIDLNDMEAVTDYIMEDFEIEW